MQATITYHPNPRGDGIGYHIETDAGHRVKQDYAPRLPYEPAMTQEQAQAYAEAEIAEIEASLVPSEAPPEPTPEP